MENASISLSKQKLKIKYVPISRIKTSEYNPRTWSKEKTKQLTESISKFGISDPLVLNSAKGRENLLISGHFRMHVAAKLGYEEVPVVEVNIPDIEAERELNIRFNKNVGDWSLELLAEFDESLLADVGFDSNELDEIFQVEVDKPENFNLQHELDKLGIAEVKAKKGDIFMLGDSKLMIGDSTIPEDFVKLMNGEKADLCQTDPPFASNYRGGVRGGNPTTDKGQKRKRRYLETVDMPDDFTQKWMQNVKDHSKDDFSIIVFEAWQNLKTIWEEMEKHWTIKNQLIWHMPNRYQGFASKYKFFSKYDVAMVGASGTVKYNTDPEVGELQNEYQAALFAISGKPQWEEFDRKKNNVPSDFMSLEFDDQKNSGQGIIFGVKPLEVLIPYMKVLTKRGDLVVEPFCGSSSTIIAATKLNRRCYAMEKSPVYAEIAMQRWEKLTGEKRVKL